MKSKKENDSILDIDEYNREHKKSYDSFSFSNAP